MISAPATRDSLDRTLPVSDPRWHRCTHWGRIPISRARRVRGLLRGMKRGRALGTCHRTEGSG